MSCLITCTLKYITPIQLNIYTHPFLRQRCVPEEVGVNQRSVNKSNIPVRNPELA